ncbi:hypothetical protein B4100_1589 [Heyndrickxia coagulans]|nr:hypothetical protein B4100_1589 [Heyndrickxia coagulans]
MEKGRKLTPVQAFPSYFGRRDDLFSKKISSNDYIKETPIDIG